MSITSTFKSTCKDAGLEIPEEFEALTWERNNRIDVAFPIVENWREDYSRYVDLLKPINDYGWKIEHAGARFMILPPKEEKDTIAPKPQRLGGLQEVLALLDHSAQAWHQAVIRNNTVIVPNVGAAHYMQILANNMADLERLGYRVVREADFKGTVKFYEVNPPLVSSKADTVADAMQQALGVNDFHANWVKLGKQGKRAITFNRADNEHGYNQARDVSATLNRAGCLVKTVEGASEIITFTAPANALNRAA